MKKNQQVSSNSNVSSSDLAEKLDEIQQDLDMAASNLMEAANDETEEYLSNSISSGTSSLTVTGNNYSSLSNCVYITQPAGLHSSISIATTTPYVSGYTASYSNFVELSTYFTEEEIEIFIDKLIERVSSDSEDYYQVQQIIRDVVRMNHFSEEFLLKYIQHLAKSDIFVHHRSDIQSGSYKELKLFFELEK